MSVRVSCLHSTLLLFNKERHRYEPGYPSPKPFCVSRKQAYPQGQFCRGEDVPRLLHFECAQGTQWRSRGN